MAFIVEGLDLNNYCAHKPIPVKIYEDEFYTLTEVIIETKYSGSTEDPEVFRFIPDQQGEVYFDLSVIAKIYMPKFISKLEYSQNIQTEEPEYKTRLDIDIFANYEENHTSEINLDFSFFHCSNNTILLTDTSNIRIWEGYPISFQCVNEIMYGIFDSPVDVENRRTEFIRSNRCCGTYLKWLNEFGFYNYWLFPKREVEIESEEIDRVKRDIFDVDVNSRYDTLGFDESKKFILRDLVPRSYYSLFESLSSSPEVYILRTDWDPCLNKIAFTDDWSKTIQEFDFEVQDIDRNNINVEVSIEMLNKYTQKWV